MTNKVRLIDANTIPWEEHYVPDGDVQWEYKKELCVCKPAIDAMPTVDAVEVVHGRWVEGGLFNDLAKCSVCGAKHFTMGFVYDNKFSYCPNCGAKMDKE